MYQVTLATKEDMDEIYRMRYEANIKILPDYYFNEEMHRKKMEYDKFDEDSIHIVGKDNEKIVGYTRLILGDKYGFQLDYNFDDLDINKKDVIEMSRMYIKPNYRGLLKTINLFKKHYKFIIKQSKKHNKKYILAAIDNSFIKLLKLIKVNFIILDNNNFDMFKDNDRKVILIDVNNFFKK